MNTPLVIAHLIATNFFGGPERQVVGHSRQLCAHGISPLIISFASRQGGNETLELARTYGVETDCLAADDAFNPAIVFKLRSLLLSKGITLLVCHGYKANIIGRLACWLAHIPQLAVSRGWTAETRRIRFYEILDRLFLRFADQVIAVSHGQYRKVLRTGIAPGKVRVIHNAINLAEIAPSDPMYSERKHLGIPQDAVLIGTAGRLSPEKNHLGLIQVAKKVLGQRPDVHFIVWGEGFLRPQLEREIISAGLEGKFHLAGFKKNVQALFHELDIFILPSHTEGLSNVILEAFACSKPVIATAVGGNPEVVEDGINGYLTPAADVDALAQAVLQLAADPALRVAMGRAGRICVERQFDFTSQTQRYLAVYEGMLARHATSL